jgi:hypothetical protein
LAIIRKQQQPGVEGEEEETAHLPPRFSRAGTELGREGFLCRVSVV